VDTPALMGKGFVPTRWPAVVVARELDARYLVRHRRSAACSCRSSGCQMSDQRTPRAGGITALPKSSQRPRSRAVALLSFSRWNLITARLVRRHPEAQCFTGRWVLDPLLEREL
jgi:hypothetical protein